MGVSGLVGFHDASDDQDRMYHGDRRTGLSFTLYNHLHTAHEQVVPVAEWSPCASVPCAWSDRFQLMPGNTLVYSTEDNTVPTQTAPQRLTAVKLGILLPMFGTGSSGFNYVSWSPLVGTHQAFRDINNKSDGVADDLLPTTQLHIAYRDSKCDSAVSLKSAVELTSQVFDGQGVSAIIGAGCSQASITAAQVAQGSNVPLVSPSSTSSALSDGRAYPYFLRTIREDSPSESPHLLPTREPHFVWRARAHAPLTERM
eukprot:3505430-Prymnesium_polylepis.1